ncbi:hypothetical protein FHL15_011136 [Xylaria flabelliformis]|uniref:Uncharacterized protein n=1 Tax=Xylaria flabelliformis TaxID=2512241 RepID=A0A553HJ59_9PEZI|nr:hypothetical protein FHL15_011136 [Xylaria flabelliformis]
MEPPSKRLRLDSSTHGADHDDGENQDELSMTPAQFDASQDPMYQLDKKRAKAATRLKSTLEDIFEKYGKDFDGDDDLVNWYTDEVEVDNGHINLMEARLGSDIEDLSGEEDERILSGESDGRGKRPKSSQLTSLIPTSHTKHKPNSRLPATSPWNVAAGPGTYRLSSLAFSPSPYNAYPPFNFGPTFENSSVDPTWQAPDLHVLPHRQHISLIGAANSHLDPFGASPHYTTKRLVSARSFLLPTAPTSSTANNSDVEEDDILLGEYNQDKQPVALSSVSEKTRMPLASCASSNQSSQRSGQQPPFYGLNLDKDGAHDQTDDLRKGSVQDESIEPLMPGTSPVSHQPAEENMQLRQTAGGSRNTSPTRPKKERPKKSDARKSSKLHNEETNSETRLLQPHERRIEIIIPLMKRLFPAETITKQGAEEMSPLVNENAQELYTEEELSINSNENVSHLQDSRYTTPPISSSESVAPQQSVSDFAGESRDANAERTVQISESPTNTSRPSALQDPPERRPKRRLEQAELPIALTLRYDKQDLENIDTKASREPLSSPTAVDNPTDGLHIEQKSNRDSEHDRMAPLQQRFSVSGVGIDPERATLETSLEENAETALIDEPIPEVTPRRSPSPIDKLHECIAGSTVEISNPATEAVISEMAILQEHNEDLPRDELDLTSVNSRGAEVLPVHPHAPIHEVPRHDQQFDEVPGISEVLTSHGTRISALEQELGSRNSEHSAIGAITEPDSDPGKDRLSPIFEPSGTYEDQEHNAPNQPLFSSVLIDEINGLQLDSEPQDTKRSPPPQDIELPDQDLSVFPVESDARFISEPILPLPLRKTQSDVQHNTGIGRSPSPELGTSIGPELISRATSQISNSPTPTTPTRRRGPRSEAKPQSSHRRSPSSKRFPLSSLVPGGIDDESDDELSIAGSFSSTISRFNSPFSRTSTNDKKLDLPPLWSTPRKTTRKFGLLKGSASSARTPNRIHGLDHSVNVPPVTDSRAGRSQSRRGRNRLANSSPLAHRVAERLLSSPTRRNRATPQRSPSLVASPHGTLRRCGEGGFVCDRDFCLTCCK